MEYLRSSPSIFRNLTSLVSFRCLGDTRDYIILGTDSGRIVILQYNNEKNTFEKIHQETFGKTGCRRIVPGQYLAVDPKGRAVMIGTLQFARTVLLGSVAFPASSKLSRFVVMMSQAQSRSKSSSTSSTVTLLPVSPFPRRSKHTSHTRSISTWWV